MTPKTLASAFTAALSRDAAPRPDSAPARDADALLIALERSATELDQIVRRRVGALSEVATTA